MAYRRVWAEYEREALLESSSLPSLRQNCENVTRYTVPAMNRLPTLLLLGFILLTLPSLAWGETFLSIGDTRSDHDDHESVVEAMIEHAGDAEFYLHSGDMVNDGTDRREWDRWFGIEGPLMARIPIVPAIGNHDGYRGEDNGFFERFGVRTFHAWESPGSDILVISVDTHVEITGDRSFNEEQREWLHDTLADCSDYALCVVQAHVGPYGAAAGRSGSAQMRDLLDEFEMAGVDLILSGHDHLYERGLTENGIRYVTSAGGGAPIYSPRSDPGAQGNTVEVVEGRHHFLRVDFDADSGIARIRAFGTDGVPFDDFELRTDHDDEDSDSDDQGQHQGVPEDNTYQAP